MCGVKAVKSSHCLLYQNKGPNLGLKVFMDARSTVTAKEGDRYPLRPPSFAAMEWGRCLVAPHTSFPQWFESTGCTKFCHGVMRMHGIAT